MFPLWHFSISLDVGHVATTLSCRTIFVVALCLVLPILTVFYEHFNLWFATLQLIFKAPESIRSIRREFSLLSHDDLVQCTILHHFIVHSSISCCKWYLLMCYHTLITISYINNKHINLFSFHANTKQLEMKHVDLLLFTHLKPMSVTYSKK